MEIASQGSLETNAATTIPAIEIEIRKRITRLEESFMVGQCSVAELLPQRKAIFRITSAGYLTFVVLSFDNSA